MQVKDQIGTYSYFPSTLMHRAAGGFGAFIIRARAVIFVPYPKPAEEFNVLVNDWWNSDHRVGSHTLYFQLFISIIQLSCTINSQRNFDTLHLESKLANVSSTNYHI